jgi:hypothetical protein
MNWIIIEIFNEDKTTAKVVCNKDGALVFNTEEEAMLEAEQYVEAYVVQLN